MKLIALLCLILLPFQLDAASIREFEDLKGNRVALEPISHNGLVATFKTQAGKEIKMAINKIAPRDREYIHKMMTFNPNAGPQLVGRAQKELAITGISFEDYANQSYRSSMKLFLNVDGPEATKVRALYIKARTQADLDSARKVAGAEWKRLDREAKFRMAQGKEEVTPSYSYGRTGGIYGVKPR